MKLVKLLIYYLSLLTCLYQIHSQILNDCDYIKELAQYNDIYYAGVGCCGYSIECTFDSDKIVSLHLTHINLKSGIKQLNQLKELSVTNGKIEM